MSQSREPSGRLNNLSRRLRGVAARVRPRLALGLVIVLVLATGLLYDRRHALHQFFRSLTVPPPHAAHISPIALTPGSLTPAVVGPADWTMYHGDPARTGAVSATPDPHQLIHLWQRVLDGAVYAQPLVVGDLVVVVTEHDSLYGLDSQTGQIRWHTVVGTPVPLADLPCGDIDPLGITGTPVYDPHTDLIYAVAEIAGPAHVLVGVDLHSGQVKVRRLVDPPGDSPQTLQQRAALALAGGRVYIAFGGLYGDCGAYHGWLVAARTDGTGSLLTYRVPTTREGAIWAPPGPVIDAQGDLYASVGNGASTQAGAWDHSDSVLRLSPTLKLQDAFAPSSWPADNANDLDLGSLGPVLLPDGILMAVGKSGTAYLLRADHLGGVGGQLQMLPLCSAGAYGGAAVQGPLAVIPCADGLRAVQLTQHAAGPLLSVKWQAPGQVTGSPVIGGHTVYSLNPSGGQLYALDVATGAVRASLAVGTASRFATPALSGNSLFVGTMTGVAAVGLR